ncbi:MAG: TonB-dependent receptor [Rhizobiales bacterium]|nr:TonB-dependent receptor [Hyphomicrobiales bacterium]
MIHSNRARGPSFSRALSRRRTAASLSVVLIATAFPIAASAQDTLPAIVVTADHAPQEASKVGASVTVMSGQELREKGVETVAEALRTVPGVALSQSGGRGTVTEVRIRGAEANHVMVQIDGIEMNAVDNGGFDFADMTTEDVERIEVLRGPQSGLYGANAHSGVISIITRSGKGLAHPQASAKIEGGSFGTGIFAGNVRGAIGPAYGSITVNDYFTKGYNISRFGSEKDGSRATTFTAKAGVDVTPELNLEGVVRHTDRSALTDPQDFNCIFNPVTFACPPANPATYGLVIDAPNDRTTYSSTAGRLGATLNLFDGRWTQNFNVKHFNEQLRGYSAGLLSFGADGERNSVDYKSTFRANTDVFGGESHTLSILADHREENYRGIVDGSRYEKERTGLAGEYVLDLPSNTTLSGALRHDWNSGFADATTWRLALSQRFPTTGTRIHASTGKGITDPSVFELFGSTFNLPNPSLIPESSIGWDAGVEQTLLNGGLILDVTYFSSDFKDKIELTTTPAGFMYVNGLGTATRRGVETTATIKPANWLSITGTYTYTDAHDSLGVIEVRRPPHSASLEATARFLDNRARATIGVIYNGVRKDFLFGATTTSLVDLPSATIVRGTLSYDITPQSTVFVRAENVFDVKYEEILSYRMPGFGAYAGLKVRLN